LAVLSGLKKESKKRFGPRTPHIAFGENPGGAAPIAGASTFQRNNNNSRPPKSAEKHRTRKTLQAGTKRNRRDPSSSNFLRRKKRTRAAMKRENASSHQSAETTKMSGNNKPRDGTRCRIGDGDTKPRGPIRAREERDGPSFAHGDKLRRKKQSKASLWEGQVALPPAPRSI